MQNEQFKRLHHLANEWTDQFLTDPSFTISDVEELKSHLLDIAEDLLSQGINAEEAFSNACQRLGNTNHLKEEFEDVNTPVIQMHRAILVLSGMLAYFFLYFFIISTTRVLARLINNISQDEVLNFRLIVTYPVIFFLLIVTTTQFLYFSEEKKIPGLAKIKIKPIHTLLLFIGILLFGWIDHRMGQLLAGEFKPGLYTSYHLDLLFDYLKYSLPFVLIVSFIILYKRHYQLLKLTDHQSKKIIPGFLIIFSGVLVYFVLYFLMHATSRILFSVLQHYVNDPLLNIRRVQIFILLFQWMFLMFSAGLYFLDKHLVDRMRRFHFKPVHTMWMLIATIILAITDRIFLPISRYSIIADVEMKAKLNLVFVYSDATFPFIICASFLLLFYKYYRNNVRITA
jgi:hypothetical protein